MRKYEVTLEYLYHTTIEVEAETFADAVDKAIENPQIGTITERDLEDAQAIWMQMDDGKVAYDLCEADEIEAGDK